VSERVLRMAIRPQKAHSSFFGVGLWISSVTDELSVVGGFAATEGGGGRRAEPEGGESDGIASGNVLRRQVGRVANLEPIP